MNVENQNQHTTSPVRLSCEVGVNIEEMTYQILVRNEGEGIAVVENNFDVGLGLAAIQLVEKESGQLFTPKDNADGWSTFGGPRKGLRRDAGEALTTLQPGESLGGTFRLRWAQGAFSLPFITSDEGFKKWLQRYKFRLRVAVVVVVDNDRRVEFFHISPWIIAD